MNKVLLISGITNSGKTRVAFELSQKLQTEIIISDIIQVINYIKCIILDI